MSTTIAAPALKRCSKCGKDVNGLKRLKDAKGHYWCMDCGVPDAPAAGNGLLSPCPKCHKNVHPTQFVRKNNQYICEPCASGVKAKGGKPVSDEQAAQRRKLVLAGLLIGAGAAAYGVLNFVVFA